MVQAKGTSEEITVKSVQPSMGRETIADKTERSSSTNGARRMSRKHSARIDVPQKLSSV